VLLRGGGGGHACRCLLDAQLPQHQLVASDALQALPLVLIIHILESWALLRASSACRNAAVRVHQHSLPPLPRPWSLCYRRQGAGLFCLFLCRLNRLCQLQCGLRQSLGGTLPLGRPLEILDAVGGC
jgi:hypothetical protein